MGLINTSIVSPILGGSCCHGAFSNYIDGWNELNMQKKNCYNIPWMYS